MEKNTRLMELMFSEKTPDELKEQVGNDIKAAEKDGVVDTEEVKYEKQDNGDIAITDKENGEVTIASKNPEEADTYDLIAVPDGQLEKFVHPSADGVTPGNAQGAPDEKVDSHMTGEAVIAPNLPDGGLNPEAGHEKSVEETAKEGPQGEEGCPKCGQIPCVCIPEPCPVCGNLPCTCEGPKTNLIDIKLSNGRRLSLETTWEQKIFFGDEFISLDEYVKRLFGRVPDFFSDADDLRDKWANPETREELLRTMDEAGFAEDKLNLLRNMLKLQKCDLLDVLEYIAYDSTPIERAKRVELVKKQYVDKLNKEQREFDNLILQYYISNGFKELGSDNLKTFITIKFNSMSDAKQKLQMSVADIREHYFELQRRLYCGNIPRD